MALIRSPSFAMSVPSATAVAYPSSTSSFVLSADLVPAAALALSKRTIILESMVCLTTAAGGTVTVTDAAATAATTIAFTTSNPVVGTTIRFGEYGVQLGAGLKVVMGATSGGWLFIYTIAD